MRSLMPRQVPKDYALERPCCLRQPTGYRRDRRSVITRVEMRPSPDVNLRAASLDQRGAPLSGRSTLAGGQRYGVGSGYAPPKMSLLPKFAGQSCWGAGFGTVVPSCRLWRQASIAGQSAAFRASFHTAAP